MKHLILSDNTDRLANLLSQLARQLRPEDHAGVTVIWSGDTAAVAALAAQHPRARFREISLVARQFDTALIEAGNEAITILTDRCQFVEPYHPSQATVILQNNPAILSVLLHRAAEPSVTHEEGEGYIAWEIPKTRDLVVVPWDLNGMTVRAREAQMLSTMGRHNVMAPCDFAGLRDHVAVLFQNNHPCLAETPNRVAVLTKPVIAVEETAE